MATKPKRVNKSKEQIAAQMVSQQKVERMKVLARLIYPFIEDQKSIYDAQTVLNAAAGYIEHEHQLKTSNIIVKDLPIDLSKDGGEKRLVDAVQNLINLLQTEKSDDSVALLKRFANGLTTFSSQKYMEQPMNTIKIDDLFA